MSEKITYVCNATRWAITNVVPLLHLGLGNVAEAVLCVGADAQPSQADIDNALVPAGNLRDFIARRAPRIEITEIRHDKAADDAWQGSICALIEARPDRQLVVNLTGGTTGMSIAACLGAVTARLPATAPRPRIIIYRGDPAHIAQLYPTPDKNPVTESLLTLDDHLRLHGYERIARPETRARLEAVVIHRPFVQRLAGLLRPLGDRELDAALRLLNSTVREVDEAQKQGANQPTFPHHRLRQRAVDLDPAVLPNLTQMLLELVRDQGELVGCSLSPRGDLLFSSLEKAEWLCGGWFEEWFFDALSSRFAGDTRGTLEFSLRLRPTAEHGRRNQTFELDAVIHRRNQLHIVECKTAAFGGREERNGMTSKDAMRLVGLHGQLVGPYGTTALASLRPVPQGGDRRGTALGLKDVCERGHVRTGFGWAGVDRLLDELAALCT